MASQRVEDYLLVERAKWQGDLDLLIAVGRGFKPEVHFEAQLAALVAVGLLSDAEAERWRVGFSPRPELGGKKMDSAVRERAERYLESLLSAASDDELWERVEVPLDLLVDLGVLSESDVDRWFERTLEAEGMEQGDDDLADDEDPGFSGRELRQVFLGPAEEHAGFRITSVELYDDGILVRWSQLQPDGPRAALDREAFFSELDDELVVTDDAGTRYEDMGGGFGGGGRRQRIRGESELTPAVPGSATRLFVNRGGHRFVIAVRR
jgi:hypothetical protein